jgi:radical SAM superfamily enzyme YgiQ (UPF0313 family)
VDYVVRGEGEYALLELVSVLDKRLSYLPPVLGLSYRKNGSVFNNLPRQATSDLDRFPLPDFGLLMNVARYNSEDMGLLMTSRGCPYSCTYCCNLSGQVSYCSTDRIVDWIRLVKRNYGTTQFTFKDDSFTINSTRVAELCSKLMRENAGITWECNTRVNLITEPLLRLMKKAGCNFIKVGIESGSERVLKEMNKGVSLEQARSAAKLFRKVGIHWTGYFMIGVPGETERDIMQTMDFMAELKPDFIGIGVYEPFPGTPMFVDGVRRGLFRPDMTLEDFYSSLPNDYYKKYPLQQTDQISPVRFRKLEAKVKDMVRRYNRGFMRVTKMACAKLPSYLRAPKLLVDDFARFLRY